MAHAYLSEMDGCAVHLSSLLHQRETEKPPAGDADGSFCRVEGEAFWLLVVFAIIAKTRFMLITMERTILGALVGHPGTGD
ncbi:hypothetical protein HJC02_18105 [Rhizobium sp. NLR4a]|uniref:hypothetical protein n=1 Tax=Rhizobium sp. NLR4a TaxID=2731117 RepID=UPI001C835F15|nr:hypothetical protein [Rhizobium sp. NLR4a]MBX5234157.1 hypothetical protein [Rhizobium sp. NLR4a]